MLETLILYFVCQTNGFLTKIQLVNFLYLADLYAVKWTGKQLTNLDWYYYNYSPWHEDIDVALVKLNGQVVQTQEGENTLIKMGAKPFALQTLGISHSLCFVLDNICIEWAGSSTDKNKDLLEYISTTAPILAVKGKHHSLDKVSLNLALERELLFEALAV
ncbi:hypothetical protein [Chamaesiphon sp.]|uniref:hypothetical protein n=1 Tax=Chamaesiphon sp. TaxID=2814140 RepID=UPI003592F527